VLSDWEDPDCVTSSQVYHLDSEEILFPGSNVTKSCFASLTWAFCLKQSLTAAAVENLITLINTALPNSLPTTPYLFNKNRLDSIKYTTNFVCPSCLTYVGETLPDNGLCVDCGEQLDTIKMQRSSSYFLSLSIAAQLTQLFENELQTL
jgi:hypothetical protein